MSGVGTFPQPYSRAESSSWSPAAASTPGCTSGSVGGSAPDGYLVYAVSDPTVDAAATRRQIDEVLAGENAGGPRVLVGSDSGAAFAVALAAKGSVVADALVLSGLPTGPAASAELAGTTSWGPVPRARRTAASWPTTRTSSGGRCPRGARTTGPPRASRRWRCRCWACTAPTTRSARWTTSARGYAQAPQAELVTIAGGRHDALNDATHRTPRPRWCCSWSGCGSAPS